MNQFLFERRLITYLNESYIKYISVKLFDKLILINSNVKYVKIWIIFYDRDKNIIYPYFYSKDKIIKFTRTRKWYENYLYNKIFNKTLVNMNIDDVYAFEIKIKYTV